jgi:RNA polymerase sigma-70 factor (ECF subfamily)
MTVESRAPMSEPEPSDEDLLRRMMGGDEDAFTALYRRRQAGVYRFALQMSGSQAIAEDVTQEVFLTLMREARGYEPARGSLAAYLYGMARHQVLRCLRRRRGEALLAAAVDRVGGGDGPLGELTRRQSVEAVRGAVLALPAHYREVVVLCDLQELNYSEAATALGCALGTVRSRLHRARQLLAARLGPLRQAGPLADPARCLI